MDMIDSNNFHLEFDLKNDVLLKEEPLSYGKSSDASQLATQLKKRTFALAISVVNLMDSTPESPAIRVIRNQLLKSATSIGANYRAVCRGRSDKEFYSKLCIVVEEADETVYWLALLLKSDVQVNKSKVEQLLKESVQLSNFFSKSRATMRKRLKA